ncbi:BRO family protein [Rhodococcus sp. NPDC127528]|uniref:BRO family protein n=1 Tax=unclassified Rhodococcus (in: high G+C Gram-positive bacteria) TaxID=192944 RepID=UPI003635F485
MSNVVPFTYEDAQVRVLEVAGEPWFVLTDLCAVLGLGSPHKVAERIDADARNLAPVIDSRGRTQQATIVSESGMYEIVIRSDKPEAAAFRRWITSDVLPSIRKTGSYGAVPELSGPELMAAALVEAQQTLAARDATIAALEPKAAYVDEFVADEDLIFFRTVANVLAVGEARLREILIERNWIYKVSGTRWSNSKQRKETIHQYRAYADKKAYFRLRALHDAPRINGEVQQTLLVTPPGAEAIARNLPRWIEEAA